MLTYIWDNNFDPNPASTTTDGLPVYEGSEHYSFTYNFTGWYAEAQFTISNWGGNLRNFSNHTHLIIAYKGFGDNSQSNTLRLKFIDNSNVTGATVDVANNNSSTYIVDTIPLSLFKAATALNWNTIKEINFSIGGTGGSGATGQFYIDNLQIIDLVDVRAGSTSISPNATYNFGTIHTTQSPVTFTIENFGNHNLALTGTPKISISGADPGDFIINETGTASNLSGGSSTTFTVLFSPSAAGTSNATITITNRYGTYATSGDFIFHLTGTRVDEPEINVKAGANSVASEGTFDFGSSEVGVAAASVTFTIENLGLGDLNLSGSPDKISISGAHAGDFVIDQSDVASPVSPSEETTFTITFTPSASGTRSATITIENDDSDEDSYVIQLTGEGAITGATRGSSDRDSFISFPSPFSSNTVIRINSSLQLPMTITVADINGKIVYTENRHNTNEEIVLGEELENGVYWVRAVYGSNMKVIKIIKI